MKLDELAFANDQIAGMLNAGIPLEGALKKVATDIKKGAFRDELAALEEDLSKGTPFETAVSNRKFPEFYKQMVIVGAKTDSLPTMLATVADHYRNRAEIAVRLSGLMIYPLLLLLGTVSLSLYMAIKLPRLLVALADDLSGFPISNFPMTNAMFWIWSAPVMLIITSLVVLVVLLSPTVRNLVKWRVSPFREGNLGNLAGMIAGGLESGMTLHEALQLVRHVENAGVKRDLDVMCDRISSGKTLTEAYRDLWSFSDTFKWLSLSAGEDVAKGFRMAQEFLCNRAKHRCEVLLYGVMPAAILILAFMILTQLQGFWTIYRHIIESIG